MADDSIEFDEPAHEDVPVEPEDQTEIEVDGGDLPKFDPEFELEHWDTEEGPVVGVRYDGPEVPSKADRVAFVRAAMEHG